MAVRENPFGTAIVAGSQMDSRYVGVAVALSWYLGPLCTVSLVVRLMFVRRPQAQAELWSCLSRILRQRLLSTKFWVESNNDSSRQLSG